MLTERQKADVLAKIRALTEEHNKEKKFAEAALAQYGSELAGDVFDKAKALGEKVGILCSVLEGTLNPDAIELTEAQLKVLDDELKELQGKMEKKRELLARMKKAKELL